MSNDNYPAGVTDAHPHFNPNEHSVTVSCTSDEAMTVPAHAVQEELAEVKRLLDLSQSRHGTLLNATYLQLGHAVGRLQRIQREESYECQWEGTLDLPYSEEAEFTCPRCGVTQTTDTIPEDRDPDEGWDNRHDD